MRAWVDPSRLTAVFVIGGLLLRLYHYALNHVIWYDESVLLANVLGKSFGQLLGPLDSEVAAPPFYLWTLKLIHLTFGDEPYVWRAFPLLAGCGMLLLLVPLARAVLTPYGAAFAVGLLAVSDEHIRQSNTVKPYTLDALFAAAVLYGLMRTEIWPLVRRQLALAVVSPFILCYSYPMAFVLGGVLLSLWPRDRKSFIAWAVAGVAIAGTFAMLYFGPIRAQRVTGLVDGWERYFLPIRDPQNIPLWLVWNVFGVCQYACSPSGAALAVLTPFAAVAFWRSNHWRLTVAVGGLVAAVLAASAMRAWPFGQHRLMLFAAPAVYLLGAKGVELLAGSRTGWRRWLGVGLAVACIVVANGLCLWRMVHLWSEPDARGVTKYVREHRQPGEPVLSDEGGYLYYFHGEIRPLSAGKDVPVGGRLWAVMDHYTPEVRHAYIDDKLDKLGVFERVHAEEFTSAGAYLYERKR